MQLEPSLPKLLALDKRNNGFDDRITEAATIAGINLFAVDSKGTSTEIPSRTRSEFVLRWALEKFKTPESRKICCESALLWPLLNGLIPVVPTSSIARLLQTNGFVKNVGLLLDECAKSASSSIAQPSEPTKATTSGAKPSKKRKRGEKQPSPQSEDITPLPIEHFEKSVLGITSVLQSIIALTRGPTANSDHASQAHISSSLKTDAETAAQLLSAWLQCLGILLQQPLSSGSLLEAHDDILHMWSSRSREQSDETGASPGAFSKQCLVPLAELLSDEVLALLRSNADGPKIQASLERLLAKHLLVPAHTSFDSRQLTKNPTLQKSKAALVEYLEPLGAAISKRSTSDATSAKMLLTTVPRLLDLAIRLPPRATPTQQSAQIPWLKSVFSALATCAMEDLTHEKMKKTASNHEHSPLTAMLHVLKSHGVNLSSEFLESVLVACSGLRDLRKGNTMLRLDVVAALLDLNGGIFLKEVSSKDKVLPAAQAGQPPYVEALISSMSEIKWEAPAVVNGSIANGTSDPTHTASFAVQSITIPLLRAYTASRKLPSFISLWFWEVRRNWKIIGTSDEATQLPWLSLRLVQAFRNVLEDSLSPSRMGELLIEFILPVRQLLDEASRSSSFDWASVPTTAPASAALVILDALLHSIEREETLQGNQAAWLALKDIPQKLAIIDLTGFPAAARVWSVVTRVYKLSYFVDGKEAFLAQQKQLLQGDEVFKAAVAVAQQVGKENDSDLRFSALAFVWTVCGHELDAELGQPAHEALERVLAALEPAITPDTTVNSTENIAQITQLCVQYPATLPLISRKPRLQFFQRLQSCILDTKVIDAVDALLAVLLDGSPHVLEQFVSVLVEALTTVDEVAQIQAASLRLLLRVPPQSVLREVREAVIDTLASPQNARSGEDVELGLFEMSIALMGRMLSGGSCGSAVLVSSSSSIYIAT